jgi:hypothetical protein
MNSAVCEPILELANLSCSARTAPTRFTKSLKGAGLTLVQTLFEITVNAAGGTPAHDVHLRHLDWEQFPRDVPYVFGGVPFDTHKNFVEVIESKDYLLPSGTTSFKTAIKVDDFRAATLGVATMRIYGRVNYYDVFDKGWAKDFCFIYTVGNFSVCPEHNGDHAAQ